MPRQYNLPDRKAALQARADAILFLRTKKDYSWRAIAYALQLTPEQSKTIALREIRRRGDKGCGAHQWQSGLVEVSGLKNTFGEKTFPSLTCSKCGRVEYLNPDGKWVEFKPGTVKYKNIP